MSDLDSILDEADRARHDRAMDADHRDGVHDDDPTDFPDCYLCARILALADEHSRGQHAEPVDDCAACEDYDDDAMTVYFPPCEASNV